MNKEIFMNITSSRGIQFRLSLGIPLNSEIKRHLEQSHLWKEAQLDPKKNPPNLEITHFQNKEYLGFSIPEPTTSVEHLQTLEDLIEKKLSKYTNPLLARNLKTKLFAKEQKNFYLVGSEYSLSWCKNENILHLTKVERAFQRETLIYNAM